ncbi:DAK2 domain-containing protein [Nocardioides sp. Kera G14]|uniref:DAK2 domain-containing protein n=1 Tax=Nocardioides sp. Kera G14 TaxID=2884264 RepID=UPI001D10EAA3|nr:DAK2 domain-containing protein [Nocardioides sp. Kera G14]UDY22682.1 DAK2 domain-containing protein [Nocardioides sp. Kera G14]
MQTVSLATIIRFADLATESLTAAREEIDALNVFPVPDGDTGTNMLLTMSAARDALRAAAPDEEGGHDPGALDAFCRGALLGARGNSGVILAEMLGALIVRLADQGDDEPLSDCVAAAFVAAADASYAAVGTPVEGTILTVCRAASDAAVREAKETDSVEAVLAASAEAARVALAETPELLPRLKDAGVVDAGGRGLVLILEAAEAALTGTIRRSAASPGTKPERKQEKKKRQRKPRRVPGDDLTPDGPAYEVMYLLEADELDVATLRHRLAPLGDSLVLTGREGLWNVHVHVDDVGAAIEAGIDAGRPHRIRVTHFAADQHRETPRQKRSGRAVIAVAAGKGLDRLFRDAGAHVVRSTIARRPSVGQLLKAIERTGAAEVVVLPNDGDSLRVAQIAAATADADHGIRVEVIPSHAQVQGLAALAVHDPERAFDRDVLEMTAAASHTRHGAVTIAAKRAITSGGTCEKGDALGAIDGDFTVIGERLDEVATKVLHRLLGAGGELVTLVAGADKTDAQLATATASWLETHHPTVDVSVLVGGQARYPLLIGVE